MIFLTKINGFGFHFIINQKVWVDLNINIIIAIINYYQFIIFLLDFFRSTDEWIDAFLSCLLPANFL